ncbi:hypothetical protein [Staphylococcus ureilyticus]|uniref:hypothetical protein n=1 Tax=Staphylococcus ureilyticus TaxID=94138 RepID=UPI00387B6D90
MKNILLSIIALVLAASLGFGIFVYFDTRDNTNNQKNHLTKESNKDDGDNSKEKNNSTKNENNDEVQSNNENEEQKTPSMVEVLHMIDNGEDVNGIVDKEGNTWTMNPGIAVGYTNPEGERYSSGLNYKGDIDGTDFNKDYDPEDEEIEYAEKPDPEVIAELQDEIDNAGLQTEMEAKQKELDDYINSFPE